MNSFDLLSTFRNFAKIIHKNNEKAYDKENGFHEAGSRYAAVDHGGQQGGGRAAGGRCPEKRGAKEQRD
jgi:hypothetical protein